MDFIIPSFSMFTFLFYFNLESLSLEFVANAHLVFFFLNRERFDLFMIWFESAFESLFLLLCRKFWCQEVELQIRADLDGYRLKLTFSLIYLSFV